MATYTSKLNLKKPEGNELFNRVQDLNDNWDKIDVHAHDDDYYTEAESDALLLTKVDKETGKSLVSDATILDLTDGNETTLHKHSSLNTPFTPIGNLSSTNVQTALAELDTNKVDKVTGKGLSTNDYTTEEKSKVSNLPSDTNSQLADIANGTGIKEKVIAKEKLNFTPVVGVQSVNRFNKNTIIPGKFVSPTNGNFTNSATFSISDFIEVVPEEDIAINIFYQIAFYNENKVFISGVSGSDELFRTVQVPLLAKYVVVTIRNTNVHLYQLQSGTVSTTYEPYGVFVTENQLSESLKEIFNQPISLKKPAEIFSEILKFPAPRIKLLGDSITAGVGGTGYAQDGDLIPSTTIYINTSGYCWANKFKDLMARKFSATVINYGMSGKNSGQVYNIRDVLIEDNDDLIIMMIGTNDRHNYTDTTFTKQYQRGIVETALNKGAKVILMSANPVAVDNDNDPIRNFGMFDVDKAIRELALEYNMGYISNYDAFLQYSEFRGVSVDTLLADGIHPNDSGYDVMFRNIIRNLGISYIRDGITK